MKLANIKTFSQGMPRREKSGLSRSDERQAGCAKDECAGGQCTRPVASWQPRANDHIEQSTEQTGEHSLTQKFDSAVQRYHPDRLSAAICDRCYSRMFPQKERAADPHGDTRTNTDR